MRDITVVSTTASKKVVISSSARTWGQLKGESAMAALLGSNMEGVVRESKITLKNDDAVLPDGPCTIFLVQSKTKAGAYTEEQFQSAILSALENVIGSITEDVASELGINFEEPEDDDSLLAEAREFE